MKIEESTQQVAVNPFRNEKVEEQAANQAVKPAEASLVRGDNVTLSPSVERVNKASESLKEIPDSRPDRVKELKVAVESGRYQVDSKDVAAKMISALKNGYTG
ncbi:flagellar biosynthesis anti-sigma factor FlgM [Geobacter sp. DSM 9736]|uniref:flagellar biosynthesis anti-sigma factor FlgM n=1 Tax=Geobacter sp. DSM 9736 TaxID=1277350 RepID=UPI000B50CA97|nr:flagellar biosynthesis anti-sigma factor FlgM [Geobacter sp. DSM 9736]SNB45739.1 anti-sigma-28 factor, FlgM family [Geobacter sp. DSM 9736]